jgi:hypothetical protein
MGRVMSFEQVKVLARRVFLYLAICAAVTWICDYLSVQFKFPYRNPIGNVPVQTYYAVPQKDGKTEFLFDQPATQDCVHSIFPHSGYNPCWYVSRHKQRRVDM